MAAVIQFPMEDYGVNSEFKESDSPESQKVSGYSAPLDIQPLVPRSKLRGYLSFHNAR
jgi:hypothetical protein